MTIPNYQEVMLPLLRLTAHGAEHTVRGATKMLAKGFNLSDSEINLLLPSGRQTVFENRVGWARVYLKKAGLLLMPRRGVFCITDRGKEVLGTNPNRIDSKFLEQFEEFQEFRAFRRNQGDSSDEIVEDGTSMTPEESIAIAHKNLQAALASELLSKIKECSPRFFENLVIDLLLKMGYGGSREDAGRAVGGSGDGGIDGVISEDRLGLDNIYIQAKRWEGTVGRPEIQKFVGALRGHRATKGIFITTSSFSSDALDYVRTVDTKVVLIDGKNLTTLMIDVGIGVSVVSSVSIKRLDGDYFIED